MFYQSLLNDYFDEHKTIIVTTHQVEEIEYILTDLLFIRDGKIVLDATMDEDRRALRRSDGQSGQSRCRACAEAAHERQIFGKSIFLFDGIDRARLAALGELHKPSVADLFVATMKGTYA